MSSRLSVRMQHSRSHFGFMVMILCAKFLKMLSTTKITTIFDTVEVRIGLGKYQKKCVNLVYYILDYG